MTAAGPPGSATSGSGPYGSVSLWLDTLGEDVTPRPPLEGDTDADVAIVGAGYTGLWTAYYLAVADPSLRVVVVERETAGFGASGRNGGWCSALFAASTARVASLAGRDAAVALQRALNATVDEVGKVAAAEGIDCHFAKGGTITLARSPAQLERAREHVAAARGFGFGADDLDLLPAQEARDRLGASSVLGALYTPHCAAVHPARLARGLAAAAERRGVRILERTPATRLVTSPGPRRVETPHGHVRADVVVRATEGYTHGIPGHRRALAPIYSLMVATEPLPPDVWEQIGLRRRETFGDLRHLIIYGQRTADDRLAFGGRGAPYHYGSGVRPRFELERRVFTSLRQVLGELFGVLRGVGITHTWGGALGVPRDWFPSVGLDRRTGLAWGGGYVGDGVGAANLAGRTLADLILRSDSDLAGLPWVGHTWRRWEPEPLRWLGINATLRLAGAADAEEGRRGRPSRLATVLGRLTGH